MEKGKDYKKDRVLIIGATGHIGRRLVKASLGVGHPTFLLFRPANASDFNKCQLFMEFKMQGARLVRGSLDDPESLVAALREVDVVVSAVAGERPLEQLNLVEAIKEVGTIKRFLPSEFGMDVDRMEHAIPPGDAIFAEKRRVRRAIEAAGIPHTYVSANCFAGMFLAGLAQLGTFVPPTNRVDIYGSGDKKNVWVDELDVATCAILAAADPRALNKVLYVRPPANVLSQMEVVKIWEQLIGKELQKAYVAEDDWLASMEGKPLPLQSAIAHFYQIFYRGDLDFEVEGPRGVDSSRLYPDYKCVTADEYLKRFL